MGHPQLQYLFVYQKSQRNSAVVGIQLRSPVTYLYTCAQLHTSSEPSYRSCCYYITMHKSCDKLACSYLSLRIARGAGRTACPCQCPGHRAFCLIKYLSLRAIIRHFRFYFLTHFPILAKQNSYVCITLPVHYFAMMHMFFPASPFQSESPDQFSLNPI